MDVKACDLKLPETFYDVYRSRNNGEFWSNLTQHGSMSREEAEELIEDMHAKHPSDWLVMVEKTNTVVKSILGNRKK